MIDDTFLILFNAWDGPIAFTLPAVAFGRRWAHELSTAEPELEPGSEVYPARGVVPGRGPLARRPPPRRVMAELRATYRLQLGPGLGFREARGARPVPARPRRLAPLPLALAAGALRLDARLRRRRPDAHLGGARRRGRVPRALRSAGLGVVLDIVPNHMAADDENPFWRDPLWRAKFFDLDWRTGSHRRFFDVGELAGVRMEDPEVWEVTHAKVVELARDGRDRRRPGRPSGRAREPAPLPRAAARGRDRADLGREDPRARRAAAPRLAGRGDDRLRVPERRHGALRRPGRRGAADAALRGADGRAAAVRARSPPRRSSSRRGRRFADEAAQLAAKLPVRARTSRGRSRRFHVYRTYVEPDAGLVADEDRAAVDEAGLPDRLGADPPARGARARRVRRPLPADDPAGAREGRRGHGVLPLEPPRRAERGRRRPRRASRSRWRTSTRRTWRARRGGLLATTTHDTKRSGDVRARLAALAADPAGWEAVVRPRLDGWRDPNEAYLVLQTVVGAWPLTPERLELYLEKALREAKVNTNWLDPDHEWEAGAKASPSACSTTRSSAPTRLGSRERGAADRRSGRRCSS